MGQSPSLHATKNFSFRDHVRVVSSMRAVAENIRRPARRKYATLTERRYKTPARTSQTFHATVQRKYFAEISPFAGIPHKPGAHRIFPNVFPLLAN